jgi:hypothetical protein
MFGEHADCAAAVWRLITNQGDRRYYCTSRGYLAYQFGMAPLPVASHRLYVLRIGTAAGIAEPAELELPQFQVHGLRCGEGWIDVASFTATYHVTLDGLARPIRYDVRRSSNAAAKQSPGTHFSSREWRSRR